MVLLTVTPTISKALQCIERANTSLAIADEFAKDDLGVGKPISHTKIIAISKNLQKLKEDFEHAGNAALPSHHLDELLRGCKVYVEPPKPKAEPTPEYVKLMTRLRKEEEDRAYERMTNPPLPVETLNQRYPSSQSANLFLPTQADVDEEDEITYADVNRQMTLILNILISIVACSVAIWLAARHWSTPSRLGLSMGGSGLIGIGEVVVYAGYLKRLKEAKKRGRKEVEIKEIVQTWVIGRIDDATNAVQIESKDGEHFEIRKRKVSSR